MPIVGIFSYFAQIDTDGSGTLDLQEVTGNYFLTYSDEISSPRFSDLAIRIFGEENEILLKKYVECIFSKYDEDHSGDLDYEGLMRDFSFTKNN